MKRSPTFTPRVECGTLGVADFCACAAQLPRSCVRRCSDATPCSGSANAWEDRLGHFRAKRFEGPVMCGPATVHVCTVPPPDQTFVVRQTPERAHWPFSGPEADRAACAPNSEAPSLTAARTRGPTARSRHLPAFLDSASQPLPSRSREPSLRTRDPSVNARSGPRR